MSAISACQSVLGEKGSGGELRSVFNIRTGNVSSKLRGAAVEIEADSVAEVEFLWD